MIPLILGFISGVLASVCFLNSKYSAVPPHHRIATAALAWAKERNHYCICAACDDLHAAVKINEYAYDEEGK